MTQNRQPAGIPAGGQYAPDTRSRSTISLDADLFGDIGERVQAPYAAPGQDICGQDFAYASLAGRDLSRAVAHGANFHSADLSGADLRGIDARGADFAKAELAGAGIGEANFSGACFRDANLPAGMNDSDFSGADLSKAVIGSADRVDFSNTDLRGATLSGHFDHCDFTGADFAGAWLRWKPWTRRGRSPVVGAMAQSTFAGCAFDDDLDVSGGNFPDGFDPARDAAFRRHGFTADETAEWVEDGWGDKPAGEAAAWKDCGFYPGAAAEARDAGLTARSYAAYRSHGVDDVYAAADWNDGGIPADEVEAWTDNGFCAGSFLDHTEDAKAWNQAGFDAASAAGWAEKRYTPGEAVAHGRGGLTPATAPESIVARAGREQAQAMAGVPVGTLRRMEKDLATGARASGDEAVLVERMAKLGAVRDAIRDRKRKKF